MATTVFVGANSDIAKATISAMASEGHDFVLLTRNKSKLPTELSEKYQSITCNPCDHQQLNQCFETITANTTVEAVVNFCGNITLKSAATLSFSDWQQTIDINLNTAFNVAHATAKYIKKDCSVVFFSTSAAHIGIPNHEAIAAAKAGVEGLSCSFAASYARANIRSNVIAPGLVESHLSQPIVNSERGKSLSLSLHGLNRLGKPHDIAQMVKWLIQPENDWITGEVIRIDGGLSTLKCYPKS